MPLISLPPLKYSKQDPIFQEAACCIFFSGRYSSGIRKKSGEWSKKGDQFLAQLKIRSIIA